MSIRPLARRRLVRSGAAVMLAAGISLAGTSVAGASPNPTTPAAPAAPAVVGLKYGDRGAAVTSLQQALVRVGVGVRHGVDGVFGSATRASVRAWQTHKGLPSTGVVDQATAQSLGLAAAPAATPAAAAPAAGALGPGSRGRRVADLQLALMNNGYVPTGGVDGIFGAATQTALRRYQQAKGLSVSGTADAATLQALGLAAGASSNSSAASTPSSGQLARGSRGAAVTALQQALIKAGFNVAGGADGVFGVATETALKRFQAARGLTQTGALGPQTSAALGAAPAAAAPAAAPAGGGVTAAGYASYDERGARVTALQQALIRNGLTFRGGADGVFGSQTLSAIITFQRARGLPATGKVDAATGQALGLGAAAVPAAPAAPAVALQAKPVAGRCFYGDTWGAARSNGRSHLGVDIGAAEGTPLQAVVTGRVTQIYVDQPGSLSGNGIKIAQPDGTYFFYAHLQTLAPGLAVGSSVSAGQVIGYVGKTGNTATPHLHLEIHPGGGSAVNPYPIVKAFGAC